MALGSYNRIMVEMARDVLLASNADGPPDDALGRMAYRCGAFEATVKSLLSVIDDLTADGAE